MNINKIISINLKTNQLVYETNDEIIAKWNESIIRAEFETEGQLILYGNMYQLKLANPDTKTIQLLLNSGFLQVHKKHLINIDYITQISIEEKQIRLLNNLTIPYSIEYQIDIDNFLNSIVPINQ